MITVLAIALLMNQTPIASPPKAEQTTVEQVVCRNEPQRGTRITTSVCMSQLEWNARRDTMARTRPRLRPVIDNRREGAGIGRW